MTVDNTLEKKAYEAAENFREQWELGEKPINDLESLVISKGFFLVKFPNDKGISGAYLEKCGRDNIHKCIYLNTSEPIGRLNFTLAHELYHSYFEKSNNGEIACYQKNFSKDPIEKAAEKFASYLLIPRMYLIEILKTHGISSRNALSFDKIVQLQSHFKVSFIAMVAAIDSLEKTNYKSYVPKNIKAFYKYKHEPYWKELELKSKRLNIDLNTCSFKFEMNEYFKNSIITNFKNNLTSSEEVEDIAEMFDINLDSKEDK